jgi:Zn-dependent protease
MLRTFRIGRVAGFPLEVNLTFLIVLGLFALWFGPLTGLLVVLLTFGSVLLHELGHALVARHLGVRVAGIELHFFGGAAKMMGQPRTPGDEVAIAAAGPAVSFAIGAIAVVLAATTQLWVFTLLAGINLLMGIFNLIPALPMDGGRIFRALLQPRLGFLRATETAIVIARVFAGGLGLYGLASLQLYLVALAAVIWMLGTAELQNARRLAAHRGRLY